MRRKLTLLPSRMRELLSPLLDTLLFCILVIGPLAARGQQQQLNYSVAVEPLGNACPRLESCAYQRGRGKAPAREMNCACDYLCPEYGDCCVDAAFATPTSQTQFRCYDLKQFGGVYLRDSCPASYEGPEEVRRLCEDTNPGDRSDPIGSMPVTDPTTAVTYKNHFCSLCNGKMDDDIVLWTPRLECPLLTFFNTTNRHAFTHEYIVENLESDGKGGWGLFLESGSSENGSSSLFFHDCDVDPVMPLHLEGKIRLCTPNLISECPDMFGSDSVIRRLCGSYLGSRFVHGGDAYRNVHCAICNGVNVTHLSCQSAELRGFDIFRNFGSHSFALLLDINERRGQEVGKIRICESGEIYDPFFKKCRSLTCLPGFARRGRKCFPLSTINNTNPKVFKPKDSNTTKKPVISILNENKTSNEFNVTYEHEEELKIIPGELINLSSGKSYNVSDLSPADKFLADCLLISLADEDYVMLPNETIFVPKYDRLYEPTSYHSSDGSVLVCTPHFDDQHESKFLPLLGHVTVACLGVSMIFLLLHLSAFCAVPDLRNLSGRNLASQCLSLLMAYLCFVTGQFESLTSTPCIVVAFLTFYFFQVSFFWMATQAFDVWRTLKMATTELRVSSGGQKGRFLAYSCFAWMGPGLLLVLVALAQYTDLFSEAYRPGFDAPPCWFRRRRSLLVFFATPLFAIMLANVLLFVASSRMIVVTSSVTQHQRADHRRNFRLYLRLALLMGLTWAVGLVAAYADHAPLFYCFVVLNALQGLFIFVAFTCNAKVLAYLSARWCSRRDNRPREFKSSGNSSSATSSGFSTKTTVVRGSSEKQ